MEEGVHWGPFNISNRRKAQGRGRTGRDKAAVLVLNTCVPEVSAWPLNLDPHE